MVIGRIRFLASTKAPKPEEVEYWIDLNSNPYGGVIKYYNGFDWIKLDHETIAEDYERLRNKPTLNGVTIEGDKTSADYNIPTPESVEDALQEFRKELSDCITKLDDYIASNDGNIEDIKQQIEDINNDLNSIIGPSESDAIDRFREVISFLDGYKDTDKLKNIITELETEIKELISSIENTVNNHLSDYNNPHKVTKAQVGLDQVDNTSDMNKPISTLTQRALDYEAKLRNDMDQELIERINNLGDEVNSTGLKLITSIDPITQDADAGIHFNYKSKSRTSVDQDFPSEVSQNISIPNATTSGNGLMSAKDKQTLDAVKTTYIPLSQKGQANGVATLGQQGLIPSNQLPSYVDDVIECYATYTKATDGTLTNIELFKDVSHTQPIVGESGKIYVDITDATAFTNPLNNVELNSATTRSQYQFRWTGTQFAVVGAPTVIGEVTGTAFDGARGKALEDKVSQQQTEIDGKQDQLVSGINIKKINGNSIIGSGNLQIGGGVGWHGEGSNSEIFNDPDNISKGDYSHAEGKANRVIGTSSHSEGWSNINFGNNSHTEGARNIANGGQAHTEGYITVADGNQAHTEGQGTETELTINIESVSDNTFTCDNDFDINDILYFKEDDVIYLVTKATSEKITTVNKSVTISSGQKTVYKRTAGAIADNSHSEGLNTKSIGNQSHSEGNGTIASGNSSHTEGTNTIASGLNTHAEGNNTISSGENSHVEGNNSKAIGMHTHAEGDSTQAIANCSHTGGIGSIAEGYASFAHGNGVKTKNNSEIALGKFNVVNEGSDSTKQSLYSIGCGTSDDSRYNALVITQSGDMYIKDIGNYEGNEQFNYEDGEIAEAESLQRVMSNVTGKLNQLDLMKQSYIYYIKYSLLNQETMDKDSFLELYNAAKEGRPGYIDYETNHTKEPCSITISNANGNYMVRVIEKRQLWSGNNKEFRETTYNINGGTVLGSSDAAISRTYKPFVLYKSGTGTKYLNDEGNYSIPFSYQILTQSQYDGLSSKDSNTIYFIKE